MKATIAGALSVFLLLFGGYNVVITHLHFKRHYFQNQWGRNISLAEDYVLDEQQRDYVIVGSSLAARLAQDQLGPLITNLSFAGGSAATGLDIVLRTRPLPKAVLIETNILRELDQAFADSRVDPLQTFLRRTFPSAQVKYQPINVLLNLLRRNSQPKELAANPNAFETAFAVQKADAQVAPDRSRTQIALELLAQQVRSLDAQHVKVLFFRLPVHPEIADASRSKTLRAAFESTFPPTKFRWLADVPGPFDTDDGVHLTVTAARAYARQLRAGLDHGD